MAARRAMMAVVVLGLCLIQGFLVSPTVAEMKVEVKPNNYANFEFQETSPAQESTSTLPKAEAISKDDFVFSVSAGEGLDIPSAVAEQEVKPNNYPGFKFTDQSTTTPAVVYNARQAGVTPAMRQSFFTTGTPEYRGESDASGRFPSSHGVVDAREVGGEKEGYEAFVSNEVRLTNVRKTHVNVPAEEREQDLAAPAVVQTQSEGAGSSQWYSPASDPDFAFRFAKPETFGDNAFQADNAVDEQVYPQFHFDNSDATNDPTATYGSTAPVLAASSTVKKLHAPAATAGHGCANLYWAEHTKQWPSFFNINTQVPQAFGTKAGDVYGTTTLLQALYDTRSDGYSQLLSHGTASLLNSYAMPNYGLRHDAVIDQFLGALSSRTSASVQAQKFLNANHAYGPNECLN